MNLWKRPADTVRVQERDIEPVNDGSVIPLEAGSWEYPRQPLPVPPVEDRRIKRKRGRPVIARDKRRHGCLSVVVSDEEEAILRAHTETLGVSFSSWARSVLFEAARKDVPARRRTPLWTVKG